MASNADLSALFEEFASILEILGANKFKVIAFQKVARALDAMADDAATLAATKGALEAIEGIGASSAAKIREYVETGTIAELDELRFQVPPGLRELLGISGIGPKTISLLWKERGVTDKTTLKAKLATGELAGIKGFGEKKLQNIAEALTLAEQSAGRIRLGAALPIAEAVVERMERVPGVQRVAYAGSLRRGKETIGDVDILCASSDPPSAHAVFRSMPEIVKVLVSGDTKTSVITSRGVQIDLRTLPLASFGAALMYFTGSKEHNVRLRERAISMGYRLNEYGLFVDDGKEGPQHRGIEPVVSATEEEVFAKLGLPWVPPELREDRGELAQAMPKLIELGDLKAELHAHTRASDGSMTIDELILAAQAKGFHTVAITDHSKSSFQANGLSPERLREHIKAVHEAAARHPTMTVLAGSEVDILIDGRLDYEDELLGKLDIVVASPHASLRQETAVAMKRLLKAIEHPSVRILGHPSGRIVNGRSGLDLDVRELVAAAKEHDVALEINANPLRLDLRDSHVKAAMEGGALLAINCDSHERDNLDLARYGVLTGRRGWLTAERCVNTWDRERLRRWLKRG
ncbi:MAG: DNA polymerase/3'-5' exonuclease PolX [Phycisphaerae bacterium]|jgi:DNA polymerase (family 10)|nr:DNA polymerase/3'-5' exonuclease PolX [Phycisphaerae bacterium]